MRNKITWTGRFATSTICVVSADGNFSSELNNNLCHKGRELTGAGTELDRFCDCFGLQSLYDVVNVTSLENLYGVYLASHFMQTL